jgi:hypothetical protein
LACPLPSPLSCRAFYGGEPAERAPLPSLGEGVRKLTFGSGSPSPKLGRRGWGMRARGLKRPQLVLNLELLTIIADRLCGASADPIVRNAQESRQLREIATWLDERGYRLLSATQRVRFDEMPPGTYSFRLNLPVNLRHRIHWRSKLLTIQKLYFHPIEKFDF